MEEENPESQTDESDLKLSQHDINLNAEMFRLRSHAYAKSVANVWQLTQTQLCDFFLGCDRLPLSPLDIPDLSVQEGVKIIRSQNKIYFGEVLQKKKHGAGIAIYREGRVYEGNFYENDKEGFGCELYPNGNLYIGHFSQNKKHGKGSLYWFSMCGPACTKNAPPKIEQYHGDWWGGLPNGHGQHQKTNGDFYTGQFKNGLKHGSGTEHYFNGDVYNGDYLNGLAEGYGHYIWKEGSEYKGDFKQGYRNGYGVWTSQNQKQRYQGHYLLDRKHGFGIFDWDNGYQYKGNYLEDMRTGEGQLYENGVLRYQGRWENGKHLEPLSPETTANKAELREEPTKKTHRTSKFLIKTSKFAGDPTTKLQNDKKSWVKTRAASFVRRRGRLISANTLNNCKVHNKSMEKTGLRSLEKRGLQTHRGCTACINRPQPGQYSWKHIKKLKG